MRRTLIAEVVGVETYPKRTWRGSPAEIAEAIREYADRYFPDGDRSVLSSDLWYDSDDLAPLEPALEWLAGEPDSWGQWVWVWVSDPSQEDNPDIVIRAEADE